MALCPLSTAILFALALSAGFEVSTCKQVLKGEVSCSDCSYNYNLSAIKVLVKCNHVKKLAMATTETSGAFKVTLPSDAAKTPSPLNCHAKLFGGPVQLYATKKNMVSKIIKHKNSNSYKISTPLEFSLSCPSNRKDSNCGTAANNFASSKTVDLPLPPEWGLAPSSYYFPFFPIIGIP